MGGWEKALNGLWVWGWGWGHVAGAYHVALLSTALPTMALLSTALLTMAHHSGRTSCATAPSSAREVWLARVSRPLVGLVGLVGEVAELCLARVSWGRPPRVSHQVRIDPRWSRKTLFGAGAGSGCAAGTGSGLGLWVLRAQGQHLLGLGVMRAIPWSARRLRSSRWLPPTSTVGQLSGGLCCQRQSMPRAPASLGQPALATTALWFRHSQPRSASLRALDTHAGAASGRRAAGAGTLQACRWGRWCTVREAAAGEVGTCDGRRREAEGGALDRAGSIQRAAARAQVRATAAAAFRRALREDTTKLQAKLACNQSERGHWECACRDVWHM